ncbi:hypothetical protein GWI33_006700 [Rhynchophorus ferrugineus]|uniref:Elongation of very long chain fatty acids protein n=1 Tax=Rhynchophorus ferrugineus TaxID=354439 RepID=A0A834IIP7_RHYFE|nr:hypothetical protein GWI33_006700 [Rhynchophorus ferrugineus]
MALALKKMYQGYFWVINDLADPRTDDYFLMSSPIPVIIIVGLWLKFIFHWGPAYMKDRPPYDLKYIMIFYNVFQIFANGFITYLAWTARKEVDWECTPVDYSSSYWGQLFLWSSHKYFMLKIADLLDTIFFVLRKKDRHISFLHTYHHFGMVLITWIGARYVGGGHSYFIAYNSKYGKLEWLKKLITQAQLVQFIFILYMFVKLFFTKGCEYPKIVPFFIVPQNLFMIILFGDFYVRIIFLDNGV